MNIPVILIAIICYTSVFAQERQELKDAKVKSKTEYSYQFSKKGKPNKNGRFISKTIYNNKGEAIEDSVVWVNGMWQKEKITYNEHGNYLTNLNVVKKEDGAIDTSFTTYYYKGDSVKKIYQDGALKTSVVKMNDTLTRFYEASGRLIYSVIEKTNTANNSKTSLSISPEGQVWSDIIYYLDKEGKITKMEIDNNHVENYVYDDKGRRIESVENTIHNIPISKTIYKYNEKSLPVEIISYDDKGKPVDMIKYSYKYY